MSGGRSVRASSTAEGAAFRGDDPITFNEAATVLNRALDVADVELEVWYADREAVPSWAAQAVGNMEAVSVLSAGSFGSDSLGSAVTRADAAQMLSAAATLLEGDDPGLLELAWAENEMTRQKAARKGGLPPLGKKTDRRQPGTAGAGAFLRLYSPPVCAKLNSILIV